MTETQELSALFADVAEDIQRSIIDLGWHTPTPVQACHARVQACHAHRAPRSERADTEDL